MFRGLGLLSVKCKVCKLDIQSREELTAHEYWCEFLRRFLGIEKDKCR